MEHKDGSRASSAIPPPRSEVRDDEVMKDIKEVIEQSLLVQEEVLQWENVRSKLSIGNHHGPGLSLTDLWARIQALEDDNALIKEKLASCEIEITELRGLQVTPELPVEEYMPVENRSICTSKYDELDYLDFVSDETILALGGDAIVDATLHIIPDGLDYPDTFVELYGLDPQQVLRMKNHQPTIAVLNVHATILASRSKVGSKRFYDSFKEFIKLLKDSSFDESYLDEGKRDNKLVDLACAYQSFVRCAREEVHEVRK